MRVALHTLGCRANQADTIALADAFRSLDATVVGDQEPADVHVLNSCTVTQAADAGTRKLARRLKRRDPGARVVVTGCYAQVSPEALREVGEIDLIVGNDGKATLAQTVLGRDDWQSAETGAAPIRRRRRPTWAAALRPDADIIDALPESHTRPFLKVQDGCDYSCAFCIIPKARGASRSLDPRQVEAEALRYARLGARELVLTGIHLGHWGRDLSPRVPFAELLRRLADTLQTDGRIARLRLGSVEPNEVDEPLVALVEGHPLICEHLHVPLQSGDDRVLARMRRLYRTEDFARVVALIRARMPRAALGADVLVGHPGEDEASFERTRRFVDGLPLSYLHVFPFSPRAGTPSAAMPDRVAPQQRAARAAVLGRMSRIRWHFFLRAQVGRRVEVLTLVPGPGAGPVGLTRNFAQVQITGNDGPIAAGSLVPVLIESASDEALVGRVIAARETP